MTDTETMRKTMYTWRAMYNRVNNHHREKFFNHGGRGIDMDPRWKSYENFLKDMGFRPEGTTLDRIDNNKGYWKDNCRWADIITQNLNRRKPSRESVK